MRKTLVVAVTIHLLAAGTVLAGLVDGNGEATGWGLTPFTQPNQSNTFDGGLTMTIQNDAAPINYPGGVGYEPSPGGSAGEVFDLEEMYLRSSPNMVQMLLVTSNYPTVDAVGSTWVLGDLMITIDDQTFGIVTSDAHQGLTAGSLYRIDGSADVTGLQDQPRSYRGDTRLVANDYGPDATIPDIAGGLSISGAIDPGQLLGMADIQTDTFDYGGLEDATWLLQYTFDPGLLNLDEAPDQWMVQMTWGCGNDVIRVQSNTPHVPEPATLAVLVSGVVLTWWTRRRRQG